MKKKKKVKRVRKKDTRKGDRHKDSKTVGTRVSLQIAKHMEERAIELNFLRPNGNPSINAYIFYLINKDLYSERNR